MQAQQIRYRSFWASLTVDWTFHYAVPHHQLYSNGRYGYTHGLPYSWISRSNYMVILKQILTQTLTGTHESIELQHKTSVKCITIVMKTRTDKPTSILTDLCIQLYGNPWVLPYRRCRRTSHQVTSTCMRVEMRWLSACGKPQTWLRSKSMVIWVAAVSELTAFGAPGDLNTFVSLRPGSCCILERRQGYEWQMFICVALTL